MCINMLNWETQATDKPVVLFSLLLPPPLMLCLIFIFVSSVLWSVKWVVLSIIHYHEHITDATMWYGYTINVHLHKYVLIALVCQNFSTGIAKHWGIISLSYNCLFLNSHITIILEHYLWIKLTRFQINKSKRGNRNNITYVNQSNGGNAIINESPL